MPSSASLPHAAYCEEYNEDAHTTIPDTRQSANVAAKRSKPEVAKPRLPKAIRDEFSDSGYSSRTGATLGSGDSSQAPKAEAALLDGGMKPAENPKRKTRFREQTLAVPQNPRKPTLRRTESNTTGRPRQQREIDSKERTAAVHQTGNSAGKGHSPERQDVNQPAQPVPGVFSRPASTKPLPPTPMEHVPILQPAQVRPRATMPQSYRAGRPMSFHAGVTPQISYMPTLYIQPVTYSNPAAPTPSQPSQTAPYFAPQQSPVQPQPYSFPPSPYESQTRPPTRQWTSEQPGPYRSSVLYSPCPGITYVPQPPSSPGAASSQYIGGAATAQLSHPTQSRERRRSRDEDYYRMPPPALPKKSASETYSRERPNIRHAAMTSAALQHRPERTKEYRADFRGPPSPRKEVPGARDTSRRPPVTKRPSNTPSNNSLSNAHAVEREFTRPNIDSDQVTKQRRRMSYHGYESHQDLERSVEAYQASTGSEALPMTKASLNLVRKKTTSSKASSRLSGSGRGSRNGSDVKPRSSTNRRGGSDVKTRNEKDGLTIGFNASDGVNVDLKGATAEGRTISLRQSRDGGEGNMELSIRGKSSKTSSRAPSKDKGRGRYSFFGGSSIREVEPASSNASRASRDVKTEEGSKTRSRTIAGFRSRRSSRSGRG